MKTTREVKFTANNGHVQVVVVATITDMGDSEMTPYEVTEMVRDIKLALAKGLLEHQIHYTEYKMDDLKF